MLFVLYEGDGADPQKQTMRFVRADSLEDARAKHPDAAMVESYTPPRFQEAPDLRKLKRGMAVWQW